MDSVDVTVEAGSLARDELLEQLRIACGQVVTEALNDLIQDHPAAAVQVNEHLGNELLTPRLTIEMIPFSVVIDLARLDGTSPPMRLADIHLAEGHEGCN